MKSRYENILRLAIKYNASEIHIKIKQNHNTVIDIRSNNTLHTIKSQCGDYGLIRYLQNKNNLDTGYLFKPQTAQFNEIIDGNVLNLRFAVITHNEFSEAVLRILNISPDIKNISSRIDKQNDHFKSVMSKNYGLIVLSGPTGSGKTTTAYTLLKSVKNAKIMSIEDPIDVYNDEFVQLSVNEAVGFDFPEGIKQILRHEPDIIFVGDINNKKTANMCLKASANCLVIATIHASSSAHCINRLLDMGVDRKVLYHNLISVSNQRLLTNKDNTKQVIYEIMDEQEINYHKQFSNNSDMFVSVKKQINELNKEIK